MFVHFTDQEFAPGDEVTSPYARTSFPHERSIKVSSYRPTLVYFLGEEALQHSEAVHRTLGKFAYEVEPTGAYEKDADPWAPEYAFQTEHPLRVLRLLKTWDGE